MKKLKATLIINNPKLYGNRVFSSDPAIVADDRSAHFIALREKLRKYNIDLSTEDVNKIEDSDIVFSSNVKDRKPTGNHKLSYLMLNEPPPVHPEDWDPKNHQSYTRIFTWCDSFVDNKKYFLLRIGFKFNFALSIKEIHSAFNRKFCAMIVGYKFSTHPKELYSERYNVIKWFMSYHPEKFDYFGAGWPKCIRPCWFSFVEQYLPPQFNYLCYFIDIFSPANVLYKGEVFSKIDTLKKYKFSICYENTKDMPGWVTEKIFDCFFAGSIPVYWGASNVKDLIPSDCYIDRRKFKSFSDVYRFMSKMNEEEYMKYIISIKKFLSSKQAKIFTTENYAETIVGYVLKDLKTNNRYFNNNLPEYDR